MNDPVSGTDLTPGLPGAIRPGRRRSIHNAALRSLTPPRFVSISGYRHLAERLGCLALPTYRHARFRPFSKNRSADDSADPSVPRSYVAPSEGFIFAKDSWAVA
jgi:hypothetical protein